MCCSYYRNRLTSWHQDRAFLTTMCSSVLFRHYEFLPKTRLQSQLPNIVYHFRRGVGVWSCHSGIGSLTAFCLPSTLNTWIYQNRDDGNSGYSWMLLFNCPSDHLVFSFQRNIVFPIHSYALGISSSQPHYGVVWSLFAVFQVGFRLLFQIKWLCCLTNSLM